MTVPSYAELLTRHRVESSRMEQTLEKLHLIEFSMKLDRWELLAISFEMESSDIECFRIHRSMEEQKLRMLECWKQRLGSSATFEVLAKALLRIKRTDLAEYVIKLNNNIGNSDLVRICASKKPRLHELDLLKGNGITIRLINRTASSWERVALRLHFEGHEIKGMAKDNHYQTKDACRDMFSEWLLGKGRQPITWSTVITALEEADLSEIANELKQVLGNV